MYHCAKATLARITLYGASVTSRRLSANAWSCAEDESVEALNALNILWLRHLRDRLYFCKITLQALVRQDMSSEIYFVHLQIHLVWIKDNATVACFSSGIDEGVVRDAENTYRTPNKFSSA